MTAQLFRIPFNTNMTNTVRYIRYWEAYQRCTDVIYRRIPIFSTYRYCLFSNFIRYQQFCLCLRKVFICLIKIRLDKKINLWKTKVDRHPAHGLEHYFLKKKPWRWKDQFIACFPVIVFSAMLIWWKKYFCLPAATPEKNGANRYSWKEIRDIQEMIL